MLVRHINENYSYKWCVGKDYYKVKGWFVKRGFNLVESECEMFKDKGYGIGVLDNGTSKVSIKTELFRRETTGNWNCGKVLEIKENIYD